MLFENQFVLGKVSMQLSRNNQPKVIDLIASKQYHWDEFKSFKLTIETEMRAVCRRKNTPPADIYQKG